MASAISPVTPKPAAEFSTLAITKSSDSRSISAGIARRAISRPGLPKMSPMNRMRMLAANRNADRRAAALLLPREDETQLAVGEGGGGTRGVVSPLETDGAREPAERALRHMERGLPVVAHGRQLRAGDQHHVLRDNDVDVGGPH